MNHKTRGAVLLALFLVLLPAAVISLTDPVLSALALPFALIITGIITHLVFHQWGVFRTIRWRRFWACQVGAAVVATNYYARSGIPGGLVLINGSSTPPTAIQASQLPTLKVQMVMPAAIVQGTITHNWGLDASSSTYWDPEIFYEVQLLSDAGSGSYVPLLSFDRTNSNVVLVNKLASVGAFVTAVTYLITLRRPVGPGY